MHGDASAVLGASISVSNLALKWGKSISMGEVFYSTKWVNTALYSKPQHKTQPQHTTTNMSRHRPTLQWLWPSLSMATSPMDPNLGAAAPYGSVNGAMHQVRSRCSSILHLGCQNTTPQKTERETGLWP
jgi:hypothetical protein